MFGVILIKKGMCLNNVKKDFLKKLQNVVKQVTITWCSACPFLSIHGKILLKDMEDRRSIEKSPVAYGRSS